jgi:hypothetical protein
VAGDARERVIAGAVQLLEQGGLAPAATTLLRAPRGWAHWRYEFRDQNFI